MRHSHNQKIITRIDRLIDTGKVDALRARAAARQQSISACQDERQNYNQNLQVLWTLIVRCHFVILCRAIMLQVVDNHLRVSSLREYSREKASVKQRRKGSRTRSIAAKISRLSRASDESFEKNIAEGVKII